MLNNVGNVLMCLYVWIYLYSLLNDLDAMIQQLINETKCKSSMLCQQY